jgi:hypothetical protein
MSFKPPLLLLLSSLLMLSMLLVLSPLLLPVNGPLLVRAVISTTGRDDCISPAAAAVAVWRLCGDSIASFSRSFAFVGLPIRA